MKKVSLLFGLIIVILTSCNDEKDINLFDKTADERAADAIASLKADLIAPDQGWIIRYRPVDEYGSYYVLMDFNDDNTVTIKTDLGVNDGEYFEQTVSYRIDSSLGLELVIENYSFFSFLFEQNQATFGAEFEFNFVTKTPDHALVFKSKSDVSDPTILTFEEASTGDSNLLGKEVAVNLNSMADDLPKFTPSYKITYETKDLIFYTSVNDLIRTITFNTASKKTNTSSIQAVNFSTPYILKGDSIVFDTPLSGTFLGNAITLKSIKLNTLTETSINVCTDPITSHEYNGVTSANHAVKLETTLVDVTGKGFAQVSDFYVADIRNIFDNGVRATSIPTDIKGALAMQLYYNNDDFYGIGFVIQNTDGSITFALRQFTSVLNDNNIVFNFAPTISIFGNTNTDANVQNVNIYLDKLTEGDNTYIFKYDENIYEFYNPCTGWSFIFQAIL